MKYEFDPEIARFQEIKCFLEASILMAQAIKKFNTSDEIDDDEGERLTHAFTNAYDAMMEAGDGFGIIGGSGEATSGTDRAADKDP